MKAVVFHGVGDIRLDKVSDPKIKDKLDAIIKLTASAICGTDLHMIRGTMAGMKAGTVLGHEGVGIIEEVGKNLRGLKQGDRVVIPSTISCGYCSYCREGYQAQCDTVIDSGTAFFGSPALSGSFDGLQAEYARIPWASNTAFKLPENISDDQAILISDIFPTGYFGAEMARIKPSSTVAIFGCGPVGQFVIASAKLMGAGRIFAIDELEDRLEMAQAQGAEIINFANEDPIATIQELTKGIGVDSAIDTVGIDANYPDNGLPKLQKKQFKEEVKDIVPKSKPHGDNWHTGNAPSLVLQWAVQSLAKAGTLSIIGVYPQNDFSFPIGLAVNKNLKINMGNCHHMRYIPKITQLVSANIIDPTKVLTKTEPLTDAIEAYKMFDRRKAGWIKVKLQP